MGIFAKMGCFPRFGDSYISRLRPQNLECNFGLAGSEKMKKLIFLHKLYNLLVIKVVFLTHYSAPVVISVDK